MSGKRRNERAQERREDAERESESEEAGSWTRASAEVMATRKIVQVSSRYKSSTTTNPFAAVSLVRKRVAVYGGSFDPVTTAHVGVAAAVLQSGKCDEVWIVPCGPRNDKPLTASSSKRLAMCHLAVESTFGSRSKVYVKDDDLGGESHEARSTLDLARYFRKQFPDAVDFFFVIGADLVPSLPTWKDSDDLLRECKFLVHPRPGYDLLKTDDDERVPKGLSYEFLDDDITSTTNISSTQVRERATAAKGDLDAYDRLLEGIVPPLVKSFILRHRLYF